MESEHSLESFCDALWLEEGLSSATRAAYRSDLQSLGEFLSDSKCGRALHQARPEDLLAYIALRHTSSKSTSANRRLSCMRRYYRWLMQRGIRGDDPSAAIRSARQPARVPHTLSEEQVETLLKAPDTATLLGLRDKAMLECLYATGLRVSELVSLGLAQVSIRDAVVKVVGKGNKERLVPLGEEALHWIGRWLREGRSVVLGARTSDALFPTAQAEPMTRQRFWVMTQKLRTQGGHSRSAVAARPATRFCHAPAQPRSRPAGGSASSRTRRHHHHTDLHPCGTRAVAPVACGASPEGLNG